MFKTSIQRQVRLGSVARQLSTSTLLRTRAEHIAARLRPTASQPVVPCAVPRYASLRLYSAQAAANESQAANGKNEIITRFADLDKLGVHPSIVTAITQGMRYETMTEVQSMTINSALKGTDLVAQAKTGTGKTLAFLVPVLQRVLLDRPDLAERFARRRASSQDIRAIILSPTRELAEQIGVEARKVCSRTSIVIQTAVGGTRKRESLARMWREGCDVLVATPGRLHDLLSDPSARVAAPKLQAFVLDEADRMLDVGFSEEIRNIQDFLPRREEVDRQTLLFSATIPRDVVHLAKSMVRRDNFEFVQTIKADEVPTHERVPQHLVKLNGMENIFPTIMEIMKKSQAAAESGLPFKAVVFFSNTASVQFAYRVMRRTQLMNARSQCQPFEIHARLTQGQRTLSADLFRKAKSAVLFSSDVTARGMDFPNVTDVIQVGLPPNREQYIHRVGRTGRAGSAGKGWLLLTEDEVREARDRLPHLPIKPNNSFDAAKHVHGKEFASEEVKASFAEVENAYGTVDKSFFRAAYKAQLGQGFSRAFSIGDCVTAMNKWCLEVMGWDQPPAIPPKLAQNRALGRVPGVRIGFDDEETAGGMGERDDFGGGRGGFGDRGRSGNRGGFSNDRNRGFGNGRSDRGGDRDGFESQFENRAENRTENRGRSSGGFGGGRGSSGFGGNRGSSGFGGRGSSRGRW